MKRLLLIPVCCLLLLYAIPSFAGPEQESREEGIWSVLRPGLSLARFSAEYEPLKGLRVEAEDLGLVALRIDPRAFRFRLLSASELDSESRSLEEWTKDFGLVAAINAGMFWSDQRTSTGYMRNYKHLNQGRIHPDYGGFLVFNPRNRDVPRVQIVDRSHRSGWREVLEQYASVVQSYRVVGRNREIAWHGEGERYSASFIAEDETGRILFLYNRKPLSMKHFSRLLVDLPLRIDACLFTEGGRHAGLSLETSLMETMWPRSPEDAFWSSRKRPHIPNIVGIEPEQRSTEWSALDIAPPGL